MLTRQVVKRLPAISMVLNSAAKALWSEATVPIKPESSKVVITRNAQIRLSSLKQRVLHSSGSMIRRYSGRKSLSRMVSVAKRFPASCDKDCKYFPRGQTIQIPETELRNRKWGAHATRVQVWAARPNLRETNFSFPGRIKLRNEVFGEPPKTTRQRRALPTKSSGFGVRVATG